MNLLKKKKILLEIKLLKKQNLKNAKQKIKGCFF